MLAREYQQRLLVITEYMYYGITILKLVTSFRRCPFYF